MSRYLRIKVAMTVFHIRKYLITKVLDKPQPGVATWMVFRALDLVTASYNALRWI